MRMFEIGRVFLSSAVEEECTTILKGHVNRISADFYQSVASDCPMILTQRVGSVGKRSFTLQFTVTEEKSEKILMESERKLLFVNTDTNNLVPYTEKLLKLVEENRPLKKTPPFRIPVPEKPSKVFAQRFQVLHSDSDLLYHANQATYIKYCMDCAATAQQDGKLLSFTDDIFSVPVKEVSAFYKAESFMGEELEVAMWQNDDTHHTLNFDIAKAGKSIGSFVISFHESLVFSKL